MDQHEKQSSSTWAIQLWRLSCLFSFIAAHHRLIVVLIFGGISTTPINIMELRNESLPLGGNLIPRGNHNICRIIFRYRISSNNSRPSINRLPRIIAQKQSYSSSSGACFIISFLMLTFLAGKNSKLREAVERS